MVREGTVTTVEGTTASVQADTVCSHGDGEHAAVCLPLTGGVCRAGIRQRLKIIRDKEMPEGPEIRRAADSLEAAIKGKPPDGRLVCFFLN